MIDIDYFCDDFKQEFKDQFQCDEKEEVKEELYNHFVTRESTKRRERDMNRNEENKRNL